MTDYDPTNPVDIADEALMALNNVVEHVSFDAIALIYALGTFDRGEFNEGALAKSVRFFLQNTTNHLSASAKVGLSLDADLDAFIEDVEEDGLSGPEDFGEQGVALSDFGEKIANGDLTSEELDQIFRDDPRVPVDLETSYDNGTA